ncbi:MAG: DUF2318 domain-containing protein [Deltaproteobacteria bacterium]|jgi:uncharacterized membrane protein|nr:DUF2318 domain-containing protein [Deltaproteobacteria bacterium]
MLLYLLKVVDNTWLLMVLAPILFYVAIGDKRVAISKVLHFTCGALGVASALVYAILKRNTGWVVREYYDIALLWPLILALLIYMIFLLPALSKGPGIISRVSSAVIMALVLARTLPDLFILPLDFDVGMDSIFNKEYLANTAGYVFGLFMMILVFSSLTYLMKKIPKRLVVLLAFLALIGILFFLLVDATRIMYVRGMLPRISWVPKLVIFFMAHANFFVFYQALLWGTAAVIVIFLGLIIKPSGDNPAVVRKSRYGLRLMVRSGIFFVLSIALVIVTVTYLRYYQSRGPEISEPDRVEATDGAIFLPLEEVSDGNLHRYSFKTEGGTIVRFIVVKKTASAYGVGLDACDICGETGYYQRGDEIICKLCDVVMNKSTIGFPGGCNPVPLDFKIEGGGVKIDPANLEAEAHRFR